MKLNNQDTSVDEEHIQSTLFISMVFIDAYLNIKMKSYHNKNDFYENRYFFVPLWCCQMSRGGLWSFTTGTEMQ